MSKRLLLVLWVIALVLTLTVVAVKSSGGNNFESSTKRERGQTLISDFPAAEVAKIEIHSLDDSTTLQKTGGAWQLANRDNYPANVSNVNEVLRLIAEVKVTQGIEADASFAPRFGMDPASDDETEHGTEIILSNDAGSELARLTLGKNLEGAANPMSPFGGGSSGRFVRNHADDSGIYVVSELFPTLSADPKRWLEDDFLRIEKIKSITSSQPGKPDTTGWKLTRDEETADFTLDGITAAETLDAAATSPLKSLFSYARFEDVLPADKAADAWIEDQQRKVVVETFEGFSYDITFGPAKPTGDEAESGEAGDNHLLTVAVNAEIPAERKKAEDEKEEDAKQLQDAFDTRKKQLEERLAADQKLAGRTFVVSKFTVDALLKDRAGLVTTAGEPAPSAARPAPGASAPVRRPIQAVTPPIAIPPLPENGDE